MTRDFASGVTIGYKFNNPNLELNMGLQSAQLWNRIIGEYANTNFSDTGSDFEPSPSVVQASMCTATGMIAGPNCPKGITGYWKPSNAPYCDGAHYVPSNNNNGDQNNGTSNGDEPSNEGGNNGGGNTDPTTGGEPSGGGNTDPTSGGEPSGGGNNDPGTGGGDDPNAGGGEPNPAE